MSEAAGTAPFMPKLLSLPLPSTPNIEEDTAVLEVAVLKELVTGCTDGTDELVDVPKLNTDFGGLDGAAAAGGLDGEVPGGLFGIPKLNFGFCESLIPPVGAAGLEPLVVVVVELEGCGNAKVLRGVAPTPSPREVSEPFGIEAFVGAFSCPNVNDEAGDTEGFVFEGGGAVRVGALCAKKLGMAGLDGEGPLPEGVGAGLWVAEIGAEGKENEGAGTAEVVLFSGLSLVSLGRASEDDVGILKSGRVLIEPAAT